MMRNRKLALISAAFMLLFPVACALGGGGGGEDTAARPTLSPDQQATGTAGAATAVYIAGLPNFDPGLPTPTPEPPPGEGANLDDYLEALLDELDGTDRRYEELEPYMGNPFTIVVLGDTPEGVEPADASQILSASELTPDNELSEVADADLTAILGQPPEEFFGGGAAFILTTGWGIDGADEGILIIRERDDTFIWDGVLLSRGGFER